MGFYLKTSIPLPPERTLPVHPVPSKTHTRLLPMQDRGHRFYNGLIGRWINRDPIGRRGGLNYYEYCFNQSVNKVDPDGRFVFPVITLPPGLIPSLLNPFPCCDGSPYNNSTHCCCNNGTTVATGGSGCKKVTKTPIDSGVKTKGHYFGPNASDYHQWVEWGGQYADFNFNLQGTYSAGSIANSPFASISGVDKNYPKKLNPCEYNIPKFKTCLSQASTINVLYPPPVAFSFISMH
jgi:RHS repeat-associated protein